MIATRSVWGLRETLDMDRSRYRKARNRVIRAESLLIDALDDWQSEADESYRSAARLWAKRLARDVRKARRVMDGVNATLKSSEQRYREAMAAERATENAV